MATTDRPRILFEPGRVRVSAKPTGGIKIGGGNPPPSRGGQGGGRGKGGGVGGGRGVGRTVGASSSLGVLASAFGAIASARGQVPSPPDVAGITRLGLLTADGTSGSFDFQSIPSTYSALMLLVLARSTLASTTDDMYVRLNNDSGANYDWVYGRFQSGGGGATSSSLFADTNGVYTFGIPAATATASYAAPCRIWIPFYANTTFFKGVLVSEGELSAQSTTNLSSAAPMGFWRNAAAVNRVTVRLANNFVSGSQCALYGIT